MHRRRQPRHWQSLVPWAPGVALAEPGTSLASVAVAGTALAGRRSKGGRHPRHWQSLVQSWQSLAHPRVFENAPAEPPPFLRVRGRRGCQRGGSNRNRRETRKRREEEEEKRKETEQEIIINAMMVMVTMLVMMVLIPPRAFVCIPH